MERLRFWEFVLDVAGHTLTGPGGREVPLQRSEFALLLAFLRAPGRVLSRDHLLGAVAGRQSEPFDRSIDMLVSRLRRKIEPDPQSSRLITTVPGLGYKFTQMPQCDQRFSEGLRDQTVTNTAITAPVHRSSLESERRRTELEPALPVSKKSSIAVLPFQNMSGDAEQDYFADGMTEEVITALSRVPSFSVVAWHSTFAYKGKSPDIRQVGRELGVRYGLEGSVRRAGDRIRIICQLIDSTTGAHLWADRFDVPMSDIFDVQDQITASVVGALEPKLLQAEIERAKRKPAEDLQAYDLLLRSRFLFGQQTREALEESCQLLQRAVEIDPDYALALAWLARTQFNIDIQHFRVPSVSEVGQYVRSTQRAVELSRDDPEVLVVACNVIGLPGGDLTEAIGLVDRAIALNPNSTEAWAMSGMLHAYKGEGDAALDLLNRSVQLSPLNLWVNWQNNAFALAHFAAGRYEDALVWIEKGLRNNPDHVSFLKHKAASFALLGRTDQGRKVIEHLLALVPGLTVSSSAELKRSCSGVRLFLKFASKASERPGCRRMTPAAPAQSTSVQKPLVWCSYWDATTKSFREWACLALPRSRPSENHPSRPLRTGRRLQVATVAPRFARI
jgi:TolB-like protein/Tfp pilus assembly protein PilF